MNSKRTEQVATILGALAIGLLASIVVAFPVKWLWNWLIPEIFGAKPISAVQAWGLVFLAHLIFPKTKLESKK